MKSHDSRPRFTVPYAAVGASNGDGAERVQAQQSDESTTRLRAPLRYTIRLEREADGRWAVQLAPDVVTRVASRHEAIAAGKAAALRALASRIERGIMRDADDLAVVFDVRETDVGQAHGG